MKPSLSGYFDKYHEIYKEVLEDIRERPEFYRGVNLRECHKKQTFEKTNYETQFGEPYPFFGLPKKPHPLKTLFPKKIEYGDLKNCRTLIWMRSNHEKYFDPYSFIFSASKAPRLAAKCMLQRTNFYQNEIIDLKERIDDFHVIFKKFNKFNNIIVDEDISPDKNALCQVARQFGARSTVVCHGHLGVITGFLPLTADYMCVEFEEHKQKLIRWGLEPERIINKVK